MRDRRCGGLLRILPAAAFLDVFQAAGALPLEATGTVSRWSTRQSSVDGKWTLVNPEGRPVFVTALNHLAPPFYYDTIQGANGLSPCRSYDPFCQENDLLRTKYKNNWTAATLDFIHTSTKFGFNAAGYEFVPAPGVPWPYLPDLFVTNASHIFMHAGNLHFPDVFDPKFNQSTDLRVRQWVSKDQHINHPRDRHDVIGYYFEDQPLWFRPTSNYNTSGRIQSAPETWPDAMRALPSGAFGKSAYVTWLKSRYGQSAAGVDAARRVYDFPATIHSWTDVAAWDFSKTQVMSPGVVADDVDFMGVVADRLYEVASKAVKRYDPDALIFGTRFLSHDAPGPVLAAAGRHFDVISVQPSMFSPTTPEQVQLSIDTLVNMSQASGGRPVFVADQATHWNEALPAVPPQRGAAPNQTVAGDLYALFLEGVSRTGVVVGYAHCQYINRLVNPPQPQGLHLKQGLLNFNGTPHVDYTIAVANANRKVTANRSIMLQDHDFE